MIKPLFGVAAIASLVATPVMATASAAPLSVASVERGSAASDGESALAGNSVIFALVLAAGILAGAIIAVSNDDDQPVSP